MINLKILEKLQDNPFVSIVVICSIVIPVSISVTTWFYQRQLENNFSKCESDKSRLNSKCESEMGDLKSTIRSLSAQTLEISSQLDLLKKKNIELINENKSLKDKTEQSGKNTEKNIPHRTITPDDVLKHQYDSTNNGNGDVKYSARTNNDKINEINTYSCIDLESPQKVLGCFKNIISQKKILEIDNEIKKALNTNSNTFHGIALRAYLAKQSDFKISFTAPEPEMEKLREYIKYPTRENRSEMLRNHRYLLFLNDLNFQHVFSVSNFDIDSGNGQLREIGKGSETPHNFQVIGSGFGFNTPWCLDKKLNCRCRYDLRLKKSELEGEAVCTGYFNFRPLKVRHLLQLN